MGNDNLFHKRRADRSKREKQERELRNKQWLIICEGEKTEPNYFKALIDFLNAEGNKKIEYVPPIGEGKNTTSLVKSVKEYFEFANSAYSKMKIPYANIILLFDKDSFPNGEFNNAIDMADKFKKENGIERLVVAWSNESFELWLYLHFNLVESALTRYDYNDKLTDILRKSGIFSQKENYDRDGKKSTTMFQDIHNSGGSLKTALNNAKILKERNFIENNPAQSNPVTMVYKAVHELAKDAEYEI